MPPQHFHSSVCVCVLWFPLRCSVCMFHYIKLIDPSLAEPRFKKQALVSREQCCSGTFFTPHLPLFHTRVCLCLWTSAAFAFPRSASHRRIAGRPCWSVITVVLSIWRLFFSLSVIKRSDVCYWCWDWKRIESTFSEIRRAGRNIREGSGVEEVGLCSDLAGCLGSLAGEVETSPSERFICCQRVTCGAGHRVELRYDTYLKIRTSETEIYTLFTFKWISSEKSAILSTTRISISKSFFFYQ